MTISFAGPPFAFTGGFTVAGVSAPSIDGGPAQLDVPVEFDVDAFDKLLESHGYLVTWEKSAYCPNRPSGAISPLAHDVNCTVCDGTNFVFYNPCDTQMLVQGVRLSQQYYMQGRWDPGSVLVTARPGDALDYWDRITLRNGFGRFRELVRRGVDGGDVDPLKYAPLELEYVSWVNRSKAQVRFTIDEDVSLQNGALTWGASRPDAGSYFTVSYTYRPRYVIQDLLHQHRESPVQGRRTPFPTQAMAKLDFLVRDESRDAPQIQNEDPFRFGR